VTAAKNRILENGSGVALGDVDGDGWCDIYFCRTEGPNVLYRNLGNWKFEDITAKAGVACPDQYSTGAVFADVDGDGYIVLLVNSIVCDTRLFLNDGKGHFTPVSWTGGLFLDEDGKALTEPPRNWGLTVLFRDFNGDGMPDLYICNDFFLSPDQLWLNEGGKRFRAAPRLAWRNM